MSAAVSQARNQLREMISLAAIVVGVIALAMIQPRLAAQVKKVKAGDDVSALPPPQQLKVMTVGYRQSTVDLLWAKLIVEWGTAHQERRPFSDLRRYIDAIIERR